MRVMKFGGTSLATPERIRTVGSLVEEAARREPVFLVVSAVAGITDLLTAWCSRAPGALPPEVGDVHRRLWGAVVEGAGRDPAVPGLVAILEEGESLGRRTEERGGWDPRTRDHALGLGERLASRLVAGHLAARGVPAIPLDGREVIRTDGSFGEAEVDVTATEDLLRRRLEAIPTGTVPVLTGFTGGDRRGRRTTLGRGSSDYTASLVGAALGARVVEIWTDVDGVHREDPHRVPSSPVLTRLTWEEARELARAGARVLHPRSLDPLEPRGIPLHVRNTLRPDTPGSWVSGRTASADSGLNRVHLFLAGATGRVGRALLGQLEALAPSLAVEEGLELVVGGAFGSRGQLWSREGLAPGQLLGVPLAGPPPLWAEIPDRMAAEGHAAAVFLDCTAEWGVAARYAEILEVGIPVVTASKLAGSGPLVELRRVREVARRRGVPFRAETSVGAALPLLGTVAALRRAGDRVLSITGVLSGTLAFLFARVSGGTPFSHAVREARALGYTEPDPREDLSGADVARKLLILLREWGREVEMGELAVESLVPPELAHLGDPETFLTALGREDGRWAERAQEAARRGECLAYVGWFDENGAGAGVRPLPREHALARLLPGENRVLVRTERYREVPLTIAGPGAGPEVTASGVVTDLLAAVGELRRGALPSGEGGRRVA